MNIIVVSFFRINTTVSLSIPAPVRFRHISRLNGWYGESMFRNLILSVVSCKVIISLSTEWMFTKCMNSWSASAWISKTRLQIGWISGAFFRTSEKSVDNINLFNDRGYQKVRVIFLNYIYFTRYSHQYAFPPSFKKDKHHYIKASQCIYSVPPGCITRGPYKHYRNFDKHFWCMFCGFGLLFNAIVRH